MIVVAGEALIDLTPAVSGAQQCFVAHPGGSSYNVAIGLGRLGRPTAFLGRISTDAFGRLLHEHLVANDVATDLTLRGDEPSCLAFVHLGDGEPVYSFHAEGTADRMLTPGELPDLPETAGILHVGSISLLLEPGASAYEDLGRRESGRRLLSLDPNVRPGLIADAAVYRRRLDDWVARVDVVKVSAEDLDWLAPGQPAATVAARWLGLGAALVVVTRGPDGADAYRSSGTVGVAASQVTVVDTVGAGDAFTAGLLAGLDHDGVVDRAGLHAITDDRLVEMLAAAAVIAGDTCTRAGADPPWAAGLPTDEAPSTGVRRPKGAA
jgi:fructokinase